MQGLFLHLFLTVLAFIAAAITYRDIRRGGARFYTLEREAILRRASFTLMAAVLLFLLLVTVLSADGENVAVEADLDLVRCEAGSIHPDLDFVVGFRQIEAR